MISPDELLQPAGSALRLFTEEAEMGGLEGISLRTESLVLGIFQTPFGNKLTPLTCGYAIRETSVKSHLIMQTPQGEFPK